MQHMKIRTIATSVLTVFTTLTLLAGCGSTQTMPTPQIPDHSQLDTGGGDGTDNSTDSSTDSSQSRDTDDGSDSDSDSTDDSDTSGQGQSLSYTIVNRDGYRYRVDVSNMNVYASVDSSQGKPGTVMLDYGEKDMRGTVTNVTDGKQAPPNWYGAAFNLYYGSIIPLYDTNICEALGAINEKGGYARCNQYEVNGKRYWASELEFGLNLEYDYNDINSVNRKMRIGETDEGFWIFNLSSLTSSTTMGTTIRNSDAVSTLRNPVGWIAVIKPSGEEIGPSDFGDSSGIGQVRLTATYTLEAGSQPGRTTEEEDDTIYWLMAVTDGI